MISVTVIYVITLLIILIIGFIMVKIGMFKSYQYVTPVKGDELTTFKLKSPWSNPVPIAGDSGICKLYTFKGSNGSYPIVNYNSMYNSESIPYLYSPTCNDTDQLFARAVSHTCQQSKGPMGGVGCLMTDGILAQDGDTEIYYTNCGNGLNTTSSGDTFCSGKLVNIATNYKTTLQEGDIGLNKCLSAPTNTIADPSDIVPEVTGDPQIDAVNLALSIVQQTELAIEIAAAVARTGTTYTGKVTMENCNIDDVKQLFTIERYKLDTDGSFIKDTQGKFARIGHRFSGLCLGPTIIPDSQGKYHLVNAINGRIKLNNCNIDSMSGVWWFLSEQTETSLVDYLNENISIYGSANINIPASSNQTDVVTYAPQQIVFVPDLIKAAGLQSNKPTAYLSSSLSINTDGTPTTISFNMGSTNVGYGNTFNNVIIDQPSYVEYASGNYSLPSF